MSLPIKLFVAVLVLAVTCCTGGILSLEKKGLSSPAASSNHAAPAASASPVAPVDKLAAPQPNLNSIDLKTEEKRSGSPSSGLLKRRLVDSSLGPTQLTADAPSPRVPLAKRNIVRQEVLIDKILEEEQHMEELIQRITREEHLMERLLGKLESKYDSSSRHHHRSH